MKLHENKTLFRQAIQFTADQLSIPAIYIEKDYWVTFALKTIFSSYLRNDVVFKGGMNRKTAHTYNKTFNGDYGQVRDFIVLESTWLGSYEPYTQKSVVSYVGEMMLNTGQKEIAEANGLMPFNLKVLEPIRTICEKIMSLVRFSYSENPIDELKKKIRHTYDLHQLLQKKDFIDFFDSNEFDALLLKVAENDVESFRNNNKWLGNHPNDALFFANLEEVWEELRTVYNGDFKKLVYNGNPPESSDVLENFD